MIPPNSIIYLETSALNFLADKYPPQDAFATREYHHENGSHFYLSTVTISEILFTNDIGRREMLVMYAQNFGYNDLIISPGEILVNYINAGCPLEEKKYSLQSKIPIATVWADICENPAKTFYFEKDVFDHKAKALRKGFAFLSRYIEEISSGEEEPKIIDGKLGFDALMKYLQQTKYSEQTPEEKRRLKICIIMMMVIMSYDLDFENNCVNNFWKEQEISSTSEKLVFLLKNFETLLYQGPLVPISNMIMTQLAKGGKPTRGILWDALHSIYLPYVDYFLTADEHFRKLKDNSEHMIFKKITYLPTTHLYPANEN